MIRNVKELINYRILNKTILNKQIYNKSDMYEIN
jgi:hypothetical protein